MTPDRRPALRLLPLMLIAWAWAWFASVPQAADNRPAAPTAPTSASFDAVAKPFITKYCVTCHGPAKQSGNLALHKADVNSLQDDRPSWESVLERLKLNEMPPKKKPQPATAEKAAF